VMPSLPWRRMAPATMRLVLDMVPPDCAAANPLTCVDRAAYLHDMFLASDTTVALLSDLPSTGTSNDPLPFADAADTQQLVDSLTKGGGRRLLLQSVIAPNFGSLRERLDGMTATAQTSRLSAFKVYTAWGPGGRGFYLDDPAVGLPVVQHAHDLGVRVLCAHKGLQLLDFSGVWNQPRDMVAVSRQFPDMQFVVYHAGWTPLHVEGPYNPADPVGVDSLISALDRYGVPHNGNVWADIASVWRSLLSEPSQAAHVLGKLLKRLGEDRVLWGTDSVWYGPPQTQIMAFRSFEISAEYQDRYGYPALTDAIKAKVLGLNAARLFGLDAHATRCALAADQLELRRPAARGLVAEGALPQPWVPRGPVTRGQVLRWRANETGPWIPA
jgi:predicted TIM-barrel fold metal-dependent hydrolase